MKRCPICSSNVNGSIRECCIHTTKNTPTPESVKYLLVSYEDGSYDTGTLENLAEGYGEDFEDDLGSEIIRLFDSNFEEVELEKHITWSVK